MRKALLGAGLVAGALFLSGTDVSACGDKLIALGRGVRFQRAFASLRPGSILIYVGKNPKGIVKEPQLQAVLKLAGHKLQTVEDSSKFNQTLTSGKYDLVLADVADAPALAEQIRSAPSKPIFLPVMYKPTKTELAAAEKQYNLVLKTPSTAGSFLAQIDQAMKLRTNSPRIS